MSTPPPVPGTPPPVPPPVPAWDMIPVYSREVDMWLHWQGIKPRDGHLYPKSGTIPW